MALVKVLTKIHNVMQIIDRFVSTGLSHLDLTPRQLMVLDHIARHADKTQAMAVELLGIDRSTMCNIVQILLRKGLVSRRRAPRDARAYHLRLTDEGAALLDKARERLPGIEAELLATVKGIASLRLVEGDLMLRTTHSRHRST